MAESTQAADVRRRARDKWLGVAASERPAWKVGDRVALMLPNHDIGVRGRWVAVEGTVTGLDEPGLPLGVRVQFDFLFNGVMDCYATHDELRSA